MVIPLIYLFWSVNLIGKRFVKHFIGFRFAPMYIYYYFKHILNDNYKINAFK